MAMPPADTGTGQRATTAVGVLLAAAFGPVARLWDTIPRKAQYYCIGAAILLVVYPLISFAAVVYLLDVLPKSVRLPLQERALHSWNLERVYSTTTQLNRLNLSVDTSTSIAPFLSDAASREYFQFIMPG